MGLHAILTDDVEYAGYATQINDLSEQIKSAARTHQRQVVEWEQAAVAAGPDVVIPPRPVDPTEQLAVRLAATRRRQASLLLDRREELNAALEARALEVMDEAREYAARLAVLAAEVMDLGHTAGQLDRALDRSPHLVRRPVQHALGVGALLAMAAAGEDPLDLKGEYRDQGAVSDWARALSGA